MNVTIEDSCIGCGACESICDAVFHVEDRAEVKEAGIAGNEACVEEAANACPVSASTGASTTKDSTKKRTFYRPLFCCLRIYLFLVSLC